MVRAARPGLPVDVAPDRRVSTQALDAVLQALQKASHVNASSALIQTVQAVAANLTDAQAQRVLDAVLQAMRGTTDADTRWGLAQAAQSLAGNLTAQAQQVRRTPARSLGLLE
jgi:hypothetical protein